MVPSEMWLRPERNADVSIHAFALCRVYTSAGLFLFNEGNSPIR